MINLLQTDLRTEDRRFLNVNELANFSNQLTHETFMNTLVEQDENRKDFILEPQDGQFTGTKFMIGDETFSLDPISLISLSDRFKVSGVNTVTRRGLLELSNDQGVFEQTANFFLHRINRPIQFRTLFDVGMAFPSIEYTIVNNLDFVNKVLGTLNSIVDSDSMTEKHYLQKELMYCFVPIEGLETKFETVEGRQEKLRLGLELRNSEVLQNGISVAFKVIRNSTGEGILLTSNIKHVYHRHIGSDTNTLLDSVGEQLLEMFTGDAIVDAVSTMEFIEYLLKTPMDDLDTLEDFVKLTNLKDKEQRLLFHLANFRGTGSLYARTIGAYLRLMSSSTSNRQRIETNENFVGSLIRSPEFREVLAIS